MVFLNELAYSTVRRILLMLGRILIADRGKNMITHVLTVVNSECRSNTCI